MSSGRRRRAAWHSRMWQAARQLKDQGVSKPPPDLAHTGGQQAGAPEGDGRQQEAPSALVVSEVEAILAEHIQVVPAGRRHRQDWT